MVKNYDDTYKAVCNTESKTAGTSPMIGSITRYASNIQTIIIIKIFSKKPEMEEIKYYMAMDLHLAITLNELQRLDYSKASVRKRKRSDSVL